MLSTTKMLKNVIFNLTRSNAENFVLIGVLFKDTDIETRFIYSKYPDASLISLYLQLTQSIQIKTVQNVIQKA